jgi:Uma2 family endonuclease
VGRGGDAAESAEPDDGGDDGGEGVRLEEMASIGYIPLPQFSFEEYLQRSARSNEKLEYLHGMVFAMAGGSQYHNAIPMNLAFLLKSRLGSRDCSILSSDQMVVAPGSEAAFFPDLSVVCGSKLELGSKPITNPVMIVEVLSPSTREYDLGQKFQQYRRIASLRHILFLESESMGLQLYSRGDGELWPAIPTALDQREDLVSLEALGLSFRLDEVYGDLEFPSA